MKAIAQSHAHHLEGAEVLRLLEVDVARGLSAAQARERLERFGPNRIPPARRTHWALRLVEQFTQPVMYILLIAGAVTMLLGEVVDASVILGVVLMNGLVGFVQEEKAENAVAALTRLVTTQALVLRDGSLAPIDRKRILAAAEEMGSRGLRVIALARRHGAESQMTLEHRHVHSGLDFLGLQGMLDPPRPEAIDAVRRCGEAGIAVKMITGDHARTAQTIAEQLGLRSEGRPLTGREIEAMDDAALGEAAERTAVFARVAPEHKLRLVRALQERGEIVAMTGDGVNDAPALKQANIGIAMGLAGTDAAKGAADMILTDDNFASIESAVEEGRGVFDNLAKFIVWTLPTNMGEAMLLLVAILFGMQLPALPVQLLWINMTTCVLLGTMLVFEPKEAGLMKRPPRPARAPILTLPLFMRTGFVTLLILTGAGSLFEWEQEHGASLEQARTVVVNVMVMAEAFYLINCRSLLRPPWAIGFFSNPLVFAGIAGMVLLQVVLTQAEAMNRYFHTAPISLAS